MLIDVHSHCYPKGYLELLPGSGEDSSTLDLAAADEKSLAERMSVQAKAGIDISILSVGARAPVMVDPGRAGAAARVVNDSFQGLAEKSAGRLLAYVALPLPHVETSLLELERCLQLPQFVGVSLTSSVLGRSLADPEFEPVWAELSRRKTVALVHPAGVSACSSLVESFGGTWTVGSPIEDSVAGAHLVASGILVRHPGVRVIIPHLGGLLPSLVTRLDLLADAPHGLPSSALVKRLYFDSVNGHPPALRAVVDTVGAEQVLYGSDYPYWSGAALRHSIDYLGQAGLDAEQIELIRSGNAARLHGIPAAKEQRPS